MSLTGMQRVFCRHYAVHGNGGDAAKHAGYKGSRKVQQANAARLLKLRHVRAEIARLSRDEDARTILTRAGRSRWLADVVEGKITDHVVMSGREGPRVAEVPASLSDRMRAMDHLCKMHGDYIQQHHISGSVDVTSLSREDLLAELRAADGELVEGDGAELPLLDS